MANKKIPMRRCVGCSEMKSKRELIRILCNGEEKVEIDLTGKKNGRGAYICPNEECLKKAMKSKGLERSLKKAVPTELYQEFAKEMEKLEK